MMEGVAAGWGWGGGGFTDALGAWEEEGGGGGRGALAAGAAVRGRDSSGGRGGRWWWWCWGRLDVEDMHLSCGQGRRGGVPDLELNFSGEEGE